MITRKEISKRWSKTLFHFAFALIVIFGVIISLVLKKVNGGDAPSIGTLVGIAAAFVAFYIVLFFSGRYMKNMIWRKFGKG